MRKYGIHIAAVLLLGILAFGVGIGKRDLWAPDETRFGQVAREMIQRQDPFVLHVNGEPYSDKPPLHIWMTVAVTLLQGDDGSEISSFATRLPSVLGGLMGLLATYGIALVLFGSRRIAFLSAVALSTTMMYMWQGGRAQLDMLMAGWAIVAVLAWLLADRANGGRRAGWWAVFWIAAGLGTLSKGPPALIVPLGAIAFHLMSQHDRRRMWRTAIVWSVTILLLTLIARLGWVSGQPFLILTALAVVGMLGQVVWDWLIPLAREQRGRFALRLGSFVLGIALFAAVVAIWFVPYRMNAPKEVSDDTLLAQTVVRYLAGDAHVSPPWYYLEQLPNDLMPWTLFFILAIWMAYRSKRWNMEARPRSFLSAWILFTVIFFSLSPGKRDQYLLPCMPAFALFVGWFFDRLLAVPELREKPGWRRATWLHILMVGMCGAFGLGFAIVLTVFADNPPAWLLDRVMDWDIAQAIPVWPLAVLGAVAAVATWLPLRRRAVGTLFAVIALTFASLSFYVTNAVLPHVDSRKSGRGLTEEIAKHRHADEPVGIYDFFREDYIVYADYFLHRLDPVKQGEPLEQSDLWKFTDPGRGPVIVIFRDKHYRELLKERPELEKRLRFLFETGVGHRGMIVADNQPDGSR